MSGEEFVLSIVAIVAGVGLTAFIFSNIFKLIRSWVGRDKGYDEETFERLARAFMQHKKDTEQRLQSLEAIISDSDEPSGSNRQLEEPHKTIEIEDSEQEESKSSNPDSNLRNMLR